MSIHELTKAYKYYESVLKKENPDIQEKLYWEYADFVHALMVNKVKYDRDLLLDIINFRNQNKDKKRLEDKLN